MFRGEMSPGEHVVQIYESEDVFLEALERFVVAGLDAGEGVVVIATPEHSLALEDRLAALGVDLEAERGSGNYLSLDAESTLSMFVSDGWPDEDTFRATILGALKRVRSGERKVRAFGEMVVLLWAKRHSAATVRLENLWHRFVGDEQFSLFCAYPRSAFDDYALKSLTDICDLHTRVIGEAA